MSMPQRPPHGDDRDQPPRAVELATLLLRVHWLLHEVAADVSRRRADRTQLGDVTALLTNAAGAVHRYAATLPGPTIEVDDTNSGD